MAILYPAYPTPYVVPPGKVMYWKNPYTGTFFDSTSDAWTWVNRPVAGYTIGTVFDEGPIIQGGTHRYSALYGIEKDIKAPIAPKVVGKIDIVEVVADTYGKVIPIVYGVSKLDTNILWAAPIREALNNTASGVADIKDIGTLWNTPYTTWTIIDNQTTAGNPIPGTTDFKALGKTEQQINDWYSNTTAATIGYQYFGSFAVGICEGQISRVKNISADGVEIWKLGDTLPSYITIYDGNENQLPSPVIEAFEGVGNYPAHRGLAYIVFDDMLLTDYGNKVPKISVEVTRDLQSLGGGAFTSGSDEIPNDRDLIRYDSYFLQDKVVSVLSDRLEIYNIDATTLTDIVYLNRLISNNVEISSVISTSYGNSKVLVSIDAYKSDGISNSKVRITIIAEYDTITGDIVINDTNLPILIDAIDYDISTGNYVCMDASTGDIYKSSDMINWILLTNIPTSTNNDHIFISGGKVAIGLRSVEVNTSVHNNYTIHDYINSTIGSTHYIVKKSDDRYIFISNGINSTYSINSTKDFITTDISNDISVLSTLTGMIAELSVNIGGDTNLHWKDPATSQWSPRFNGITFDTNLLITSLPAPASAGAPSNKWASDYAGKLAVFTINNNEYVVSDRNGGNNTINGSPYTYTYTSGKYTTNSNTDKILQVDQIGPSFYSSNRGVVLSTPTNTIEVELEYNSNGSKNTFDVITSAGQYSTIVHNISYIDSNYIFANVFKDGNNIFHVFRDSAMVSVDDGLTWSNVPISFDIGHGGIHGKNNEYLNGLCKNSNTNIGGVNTTLVSMGGRNVYSFSGTTSSVVFTASNAFTYVSDIAEYNGELYVLLDDRWIYKVTSNTTAIPMVDLNASGLHAHSFKFQGDSVFILTNNVNARTDTIFSASVSDYIFSMTGPTYDSYWRETKMLTNRVDTKEIMYDLTYINRGPLPPITDKTFVGDIIVDISNKCNISANDFSVNVASTLYGYTISSESTGRAAIMPLLEGYFIEAFDSNGMKFVDKSNNNVYELILEDEIVPVGNGDLVKTERIQVLELPKRVNVDFIDYDAKLTKATTYSEKIVSNSNKITTLNLPIIMTATEAKQISEKKLYTDIIERSFHLLTLSNKYSYLDASDRLEIRVGTNVYFVRIIEIYNNMDMTISLRCLNDDVSAFTSTATVSTTPIIVPVNQAATINFIDVVALDDTRPNDMFYQSTVSGNTTSWVGGTQQYQMPDGTWNTVVDVSAEPQVGITTNIINIASGNVWDNTSKIQIVGFFNLTSLPDIDVLNGANRILIGNEVMQYSNATLLSTDTTTGKTTWELSRVLRGRRGSAVDTWPVGTRVLVIDKTLSKTLVPVQNLNIPATHRAFTHTFSSNVADYKVYSYTGVNIQPLSVVHIKSTIVSNDINLKWTRRTRFGQEWVDLVDVGVGELIEQYEVVFTDSTPAPVPATGASLTRTTVVTKTVYVNSITYTAADQINDFGHILPAGSTIDIYQMSNVIGRGAKATYII